MWKSQNIETINFWESFYIPFYKEYFVQYNNNAGYNILRCDSLRVPNLIEAGIMKVMRKTFKCIGYNPYPYYPRIITNKNNGQLIRMILEK